MLGDVIEPWLASAWGRRLCPMVFAFVVFVCIMTIIKLPFVWSADKTLATTEERVTAHSGQESVKRDLIRQIPEKHIFGIALNEEQPVVLPITSLQLKLLGIVQAFPENASSAIISQAGQPGKIYKVGDSLPVGVKMHAMTKDGVILENAGRLEKLPLQRQTLAFQGMPKGLVQEG